MFVWPIGVGIRGIKEVGLEEEIINREGAYSLLHAPLGSFYLSTLSLRDDPCGPMAIYLLEHYCNTCVTDV